jgi:hypothetical protein
MLGGERIPYFDANLLVYRLLLVLDLLLELLELGAIGCRSVCLQHLDVPVVPLAHACFGRVFSPLTHQSEV